MANIEGPEILSPRERADWEVCQGKRDAFVKDWMNGSDLPVQSVQEERLWLRKGIRPLLSGKPDEVLRQGARVAVLDHKYGSYRVEDPQENMQLAIYALLVSRGDAAIEEVTCQILSPCWDFEPLVYGREELDRLYRSVLVVVASLDNPGDPVPGDHCQFCPARLICGAVRQTALHPRYDEGSSCFQLTGTMSPFLSQNVVLGCVTQPVRIATPAAIKSKYVVFIRARIEFP